MARTLAERLEAQARRKAQLAQVDAQLGNAARKERTRRLIQAGGLIDKAELLDLPANELYGALLSLKALRDHPGQREDWSLLGGRAFDREAKARTEDQEGILIRFPVPVPKDAVKALRAMGFRYSTVLAHWEGRARYDDAAEIARQHSGTAERVAAPSSAPARAAE